jgi:hypothetical protein
MELRDAFGVTEVSQRRVFEQFHNQKSFVPISDFLQTRDEFSVGALLGGRGEQLPNSGAVHAVRSESIWKYVTGILGFVGCGRGRQPACSSTERY